MNQWKKTEQVDKILRDNERIFEGIDVVTGYLHVCTDPTFKFGH